MYFVLGLPITRFERKRPAGSRVQVFDADVKKVLERLSAEVLAYMNEKHNKLLVTCSRSKLYNAVLKRKYSTRYFENVKRLSPLLFEEQVSEPLRTDASWNREARPLLISLVPNISDDLRRNYMEALLEYLERTNIEILDYDDSGFILASVNGQNTRKLLQNSNFILNVSSAPQGVIENVNIQNKDCSVKTEGFPNSMDDSELEKLPIICLMDSGVNNIQPLDKLLIMKDGIVGFRDFDDGCSPKGHGTLVACLATYGETLCEPKARIISYKLYSDARRGVVFWGILRAITRHSRKTRIFLSSINFTKDQHRATAFLDKFIQKKNVCVIFSAGNIKKEKVMDCIVKGLSYPSYLCDFPVYDPARATNVVAVGAISKKESSNTIAQKNMVAPFSRCGSDNPLLFDCPKPEFAQNGGNLCFDGTTSAVGLESFRKDGVKVEGLSGTSFSSPLFARKIVEIEAKYGEKIENAETLKAIALASSNSEIQDCIGFGEPKNFSGCDPDHALVVSEGIIPLVDSVSEDKYWTVYSSKISVKIPRHVQKIEMFIVHSDNHKRTVMPTLNTFLKVKALKSGRENPNVPVTLSNYQELYRRSHMKVFKWAFARKSMEADWTFVIEPQTIAAMLPEHRRDTNVRYGCAILVTSKTTRPQTPSLSQEIQEENKSAQK
jgi:hypothetical protein